MNSILESNRKRANSHIQWILNGVGIKKTQEGCLNSVRTLAEIMDGIDSFLVTSHANKNHGIIPWKEKYPKLKMKVSESNMFSLVQDILTFNRIKKGAVPS